jgi:hypothetical protein
MIRIRLLIIFSLSFAISGKAQTEKQLLPSELKQKTIVTEPPTLYKGFFRAGLTYSWTTLDKMFDDSGKRISVPGSGYYMTRSISADLRYGIADRLTMHVGVPYMFYHMYQSAEGRSNLQDSVFIDSWDRKGNGIGDMDLGVDYQIIKESKTLPAITLKTFVSFPTGRKNPEDIVSDHQYKEPTGSGAYSALAILQIRKIVYPLSYDLSLFYNYKAKGKKIQSPGQDATGFKPGDIIQASGTLGFQVNDWICLNNMLMFNYKTDDLFDDPSLDYLEVGYQSLEYYFYLFFQVKQVRLVQSVSVPIWGKRGGADPGYFIMLSRTF